MTLSSTTVKDDYSGDGSTTDFATTFVFWNSSELKVIHTSTGGTETTWTEGTQYDVTGGAGATGTVSASTTGTDYTPDSGETLRIKSNVLDIQETALPAGGAFPSTSVEQELDRMVRRVQQQEEQFDRAPLLSEGSTFSGLTLPDPSADLVLGWNSAGDELSNLTPNSSAYIDSSDYLATANNLSDVADAATSLSNIGGIGAATSDTLTNKTFDANGTGNSLSNVDVADLANGTDGELITWDATGAPAVVAVGTVGQVLTSGGAGVAPTMQDAAGGGRVFLGSVTGSTSASMDFESLIDSTYDDYELVLHGIYGSAANANLLLRFSTNNGSSYLATGYKIAGGGNSSGGATFANDDADDTTGLRMNTVDSHFTTTAQKGVTGVLRFPAVNDSGQNPRAGGWTDGQQTSGSVRFGVVGGQHNTPAVWNALRLIASTGTITGKASLFGMVSV